jgi:Ca2+-binding RTX toxin-like protein
LGAESIQRAAIAGDFTIPVRVIRDEDMGSALGAFAAETETIYLRQSLVESGNVRAIGEVIIEEMGHGIDLWVNGEETPGDEGAIFRLLVAGKAIGEKLLAELRAENDWGTIWVDGRSLVVEMADPTEGDDLLLGTPGDDDINALGGNDTINSGRGIDTVEGGDGSDLLIVDYSSNLYSAANAGISSSVSDNGAGGLNGNFFAYKNTASAYDQVSFANIERFQIIGTGARDNIQTGGGNDTINAGGGNDSIDAGLGVNSIDGGAGTDILLNADFTTTTSSLIINDSGATLNLSDGSIISSIESFTNLTTGSGNDSIAFTQRTNNTLNAGLGNDTINAGLGVDNADGADGDDLLVVNYSSNSYAAANAGISSNVSDNGLGGFNGSLSASNTTTSSDQVSFFNIERFQITGTNAKDNIQTGSGNDTINAGGGNDTINAGLGVNNIDGGTGTDVISDADFAAVTSNLTINDSGATLNLSDGSVISGIESFSSLTTGSGDDSITFTQRTNNNLTAGLGDDTINAGLGVDNIDGSDGNDLLVVDYSANTYTGTSPAAGMGSSINDNGFGGSNGAFNVYNTSSTSDQVSFYNIERFNRLVAL